jgi:transposase
MTGSVWSKRYRRTIRSLRCAPFPALILPIADIDATIKTMIDNNPDLSEKDKIIQSVPGIGQGTSQVLLSALPELGEGNRQEIDRKSVV